MRRHSAADLPCSTRLSCSLQCLPRKPALLSHHPQGCLPECLSRCKAYLRQVARRHLYRRQYDADGQRDYSRRPAKAREIFARRKSPLKLCNWLGWGFLIKLLCHRLTVADAETRTSALLEMRCKAIITRHACIGMDIDKPSDLELARRTLTYGKSQKN